MPDLQRPWVRHLTITLTTLAFLTLTYLLLQPTFQPNQNQEPDVTIEPLTPPPTPTTETGEGNGAAWLATAAQAFETDDYEEAIEAYQAFLDAHPVDERADAVHARLEEARTALHTQQLGEARWYINDGQLDVARTLLNDLTPNVTNAPLQHELQIEEARLARLETLASDPVLGLRIRKLDTSWKELERGTHPTAWTPTLTLTITPADHPIRDVQIAAVFQYENAGRLIRLGVDNNYVVTPFEPPLREGEDVIITLNSPRGLTENGSPTTRALRQGQAPPTLVTLYAKKHDQEEWTTWAKLPLPDLS